MGSLRVFIINYIAMFKALPSVIHQKNVIQAFLEWINTNSIYLFLTVIVFFLLLAFFASLKKLKLPDILKASFPFLTDGIVFGRRFIKWIYSPTEDEGHVGVFAGTGTGKTYTVGVPTLKRWGGTALVIDISGDICGQVRRKRKRVFDVTNEKSLPYNIFADIDNMTTENEKIEGLRMLALQLMPVDLHCTSSEKYFTEGGRKILTAALIAMYFEDYDFVQICQTIVRNPWRDLFKVIDDSGSSEASIYINEFLGQKEQDISGCKSNCDRAVDLFAHSETIAKIVRRPENGESYIIPSLLEKTSIFICIPDADLQMYAPLVGVITAQVMSYISGRKVKKRTHQILLFLDEFSSFKLDAEVILEALQKYRKKRCRVMILTQNLADLDRLYGHETSRSLLANMSYKVLLGGLDDPESAKYFAEIIGYKKSKKSSHSTSYSGASFLTSTSTTTTEERQYVIEPADLDRIGKQRMMLIHKALLPYSYIKLRKTRHID